MRISRKTLRRLVRETCGDDVALVQKPLPAEETVPVLETLGPADEELVVEMKVADQALAMAVESLQNAAQLCTNCTPEIAATAPLMEAMVTQAEALQEMLGAQTDVVLESTDIEVTDGIDDVTIDLGGVI